MNQPLAQETHMQHLQECCRLSSVPSPRRRGHRGQQAKRLLQAGIRGRAVDFYRWRRQHGGSLAEAAQRLRLAPRTLRLWVAHARQPAQAALPLGRPVRRADVRQRHAVLDLLRHEGLRLGVPALRQAFPGMLRAELADLLRRCRRVVQQRYHDTLHVCHWLRAGTVWAMDFAEPSDVLSGDALPPIEGQYPYLLAVRDLASGYQLAWLPLAGATEQRLRSVLGQLFARHGPPLILKADNGPAFRAAQTKIFLAAAGVLPLYSPPYYPAYNGACEAGIGSLKRRTDLQAARQGRLDEWTWEDLEAARCQANSASYRQGQQPLTPNGTWTQRTPCGTAARVAFELVVHRHRFIVADEEKLSLAHELDHWRQSYVDRIAISRALVEHGYLTFTRRRLPIRIRS